VEELPAEEDFSVNEDVAYKLAEVKVVAMPAE
jgi:hypothetical protein